MIHLNLRLIDLTVNPEKVDLARAFRLLGTICIDWPPAAMQGGMVEHTEHTGSKLKLDVWGGHYI